MKKETMKLFGFMILITVVVATIVLFIVNGIEENNKKKIAEDKAFMDKIDKAYANFEITLEEFGTDHDEYITEITDKTSINTSIPANYKSLQEVVKNYEKRVDEIDSDYKFLYDNCYEKFTSYNRKSTTRSEADYLLQTFDYLTLSIVFLVEELLRRGFVVEAERTFVSFTYLVYFYYNCEEWGLERNKEMIDNAMRSFAIVYKKYRSFVDTSSQIKYQDIIRNNRNQMCKSQKTPYMEKITFEDWKKMILKLAENGGDINGNN